jgi:UDP-3-O-acyl-N-acetylglucosamine deacetylase
VYSGFEEEILRHKVLEIVGRLWVFFSFSFWFCFCF